MTKRKPMSAAEFSKQLAQDANYVAQEQKREERLARSVARSRASEKPVLDELRGAGYDLHTVWDLVNTETPYPEALPILLKHLQLGSYPNSVKEGMASALATRASHPYWNALRELYLSERDSRAKEGLAVALAASAEAEDLPELRVLVEDPNNGFTRLHFLRSIRRLAGVQSIALYHSIPDLRKEVDSLIHGGEIR